MRQPDVIAVVAVHAVRFRALARKRGKQNAEQTAASLPNNARRQAGIVFSELLY